MKITYKNTFCDLVAFLWNHLIRSPVWIGIMLIFSGFVSWSTIRNSAEEHTTIIIVLSWFIMTAIIFTAILLFIFVLSALAMISRKNKTFLTDNTIELTDNGIIMENRYERSECVWDIVQRLKRTKRFIFVYVNQNAAIIVPKRAFPNDQEWNGFYEILESHYRSN